MRDVVVTVIRTFEPTAMLPSDWDFLRTSSGKPVAWHEMSGERRVLILADPGAGKTFEALQRARSIRDAGKRAFFIRIERMDAAFEEAFEVGDAAGFEEWLSSTDDAWFFLDSVDEAQLETPRALEDAIRIFGGRIHDARERARIVVTSREDAWQALPDRTLFEQYLPYGEPRSKTTEADEDAEEGELRVYRLAGLTADQIRLFAAYHDVDDVPRFMAALDAGNLMTLAARPFDLKALIGAWKDDGTLGGRLAVLRRMIKLQLATLSARDATPKIAGDRAAAGARALAAAVTLTGRTIIRLPDGVLTPDRIDPAVLLEGWSDPEIDALLRTGIFDDVVYGSVRLRHREIRELLTAEWALALVGEPGGRGKVEGLFFRISYGEEVIVPRLRPVLTWLLLFDEAIRDRALRIAPEIASEGGDPSQLPIEIRSSMLVEIVDRIVKRSEG